MVAAHPSGVSSQLRGRAGAYAGRVAKLWPAPHTPYLSLPTQRRHLVHVTLARIEAAPGRDARAYARDAAAARLKVFWTRWGRGLAVALPRIACKMGERAWRPAEYRALLGLTGGCVRACQVLRHAERVNPQDVHVLAGLPPVLRAAGVVRHVANAYEAETVRGAVDLVRRLDPRPDALRILAERLEHTASRAAFYAALVDAVQVGPLAQPFEATPLLVPLTSAAEVRDAGRRFRNCLGGLIGEAQFGSSAFVEWRGEEPAVMQLEHEGAAGWRLCYVLGVDNREVSPATRRAIKAHLAKLGVRRQSNPQWIIGDLASWVNEDA